MELNDAELYGIDLQKLKQESFSHIGHVIMLREHYKRVKWWENYQKQQWRHTEGNESKQLDRDKITPNKKNGH